MDEALKIKIKADLSVVKAVLSPAANASSALHQTIYPVAGPVITIPALGLAGQAFKAQSDAIERLTSAVEKILDTL